MGVGVGLELLRAVKINNDGRMSKKAKGWMDEAEGMPLHTNQGDSLRAGDGRRWVVVDSGSGGGSGRVSDWTTTADDDGGGW